MDQCFGIYKIKFSSDAIYNIKNWEKAHPTENLPYRDEAKDSAGSTNHRDNITV